MKMSCPLHAAFPPKLRSTSASGIKESIVVQSIKRKPPLPLSLDVVSEKHSVASTRARERRVSCEYVNERAPPLGERVDLQPVNTESVRRSVDAVLEIMEGDELLLSTTMEVKFDDVNVITWGS